MSSLPNGEWPESVRPAAAEKFGARPDSIQLIGGFVNLLLTAIIDSKPRVLRITRGSRCTAEMLGAELHWVNYLADRDVPVARPVRSPRNETVETVEIDGAVFHISAFEEAPGRSLRVHEFSDELIGRWGSLVGRIHASGRSYQPPGYDRIRPMWDQDPDIAQPAAYLPSDQTAICERVTEYCEELRTWSTEPAHFGLIHSDLHPSNFHVDGSSITLFDFDDCRYEWYASEIASILFFLILDPPADENASDFAHRFLAGFLTGYRQEMNIDSHWLARIPLLLKFREVSQYVAMYRVCDMNNLNDWCRRFLSGRRESVEYRTPMVELDMSRFT